MDLKLPSTQWLRMVLWISVLLEVCFIPFGVIDVVYSPETGLDLPDILKTAMEYVPIILTTLMVIPAFVGFILLCVWSYGAVQRVHTVQNSDFKWKPWVVVVGLLVPVVNWVVPYLVWADLAKKVSTIQNPAPLNMLYLRWVLDILGNLMVLLVIFITLAEAFDLDKLAEEYTPSLLSNALDLLISLIGVGLNVVMVRFLQGMEERSIPPQSTTAAP